MLIVADIARNIFKIVVLVVKNALILHGFASKYDRNRFGTIRMLLQASIQGASAFLPTSDNTRRQECRRSYISNLEIVPLFGYDAEDEFGYQWVDSNRNPVVFPAKIYLPGATETPEPADVLAEEITLSHESYEGYAGDIFTIEATVKPDETTDKTVEWSTDDPTVATVENGKVTLLSTGETMIRAKCGNVSAACQVKVKEVSSVDSLIQDSDSSAVYYTVEGVKATLPLKPGVYIRVVNGKAVKIIIK